MIKADKMTKFVGQNVLQVIVEAVGGANRIHIKDFLVVVDQDIGVAQFAREFTEFKQGNGHEGTAKLPIILNPVDAILLIEEIG